MSDLPVLTREGSALALAVKWKASFPGECLADICRRRRTLSFVNLKKNDTLITRYCAFKFVGFELKLTYKGHGMGGRFKSLGRVPDTWRKDG